MWIGSRPLNKVPFALWVCIIVLRPDDGIICLSINIKAFLQSSFRYLDLKFMSMICRYIQRLGLKVGRTWAFNSGLPNLPGQYDEEQFEALDFVIYAAGR
jgi:hypothetical protein